MKLLSVQIIVQIRKYTIRIYILIWTWTPLVHYALSGGFSMFPRLICEIRCPDFHLSKSGHEGKIWTKSVLPYIILEEGCHRREMRRFMGDFSQKSKMCLKIWTGRFSQSRVAEIVRGATRAEIEKARSVEIRFSESE